MLRLNSTQPEKTLDKFLSSSIEAYAVMRLIIKKTTRTRSYRGRRRRHFNRWISCLVPNMC